MDYLDVQTTFVCPENVNFTIQGSVSSQLIKFLYISVNECDQQELDLKYNGTKKCKPYDDILRVAGHLKLNLILQNSYFEDHNFSPKPVVDYLKLYQLTSKFNTSNNYYILLSEN